MKRKMLLSVSAFFLCITFLIISNDSTTIKKTSLNDNNADTQLSIRDMINITGGDCSGDGEYCGDYNHTCPSDCTHVSASECKGSGSTCDDDHYVVACRCPDGYDFIKGCL